MISADRQRVIRFGIFMRLLLEVVQGIAGNKVRQAAAQAANESVPAIPTLSSLQAHDSGPPEAPMLVFQQTRGAPCRPQTYVRFGKVLVITWSLYHSLF